MYYHDNTRLHKDCDKYTVKNKKVNIVKITLVLQELVGGFHAHTPKVKINMCFKNLCTPTGKVNY